MGVRFSVMCRIGAVIILAGTPATMGFAQDCGVSIIVRVLDKQAQPVANVTAGQLKARIGSPKWGGPESENLQRAIRVRIWASVSEGLLR